MLVVLLTALLLSDSDTDRRPNILVLMADDLRPDAAGSLGMRFIQTPNIDSLAAQGTVFRHAYCLGSNVGAVCAPSRNMFLSGRSYFRWKGRMYAPADQPNLPTTFRNAGYSTFHCGKRGNVALTIERLFESTSYLEDDKERRSGEPGKTVVDRAIEWLSHRDANKPFCMYLAFEAPHDPRVASDRYRAPYDPEATPIPTNFLPLNPFDNGELRVRDEQLAAWPRTEAELRKHWSDYAAVITGLDHHIGRLLDDLKRQGTYDRTVIVFASDNGLALGSHGLMGKQSLYEHSMGVPLVIAGPGIKPGRTESLAYLLDVFPTLCDLAGLPCPEGLDGRSLVGVLREPSAPTRDEVLLCYRDVQRAIRDQQWKLIYYPKIGKNQLFDLSTDPNEMHDLSQETSQQETIKRLWPRLQVLQKSLGDDLVLANNP
jgi:arylsulfatase A-like enzyme